MTWWKWLGFAGTISFLLVACGDSTPSGEGSKGETSGNDPGIGSGVTPGGATNPVDGGAEGSVGPSRSDAGGGENFDGGSSTTRYPECDSYAATYCRCLGSAAAANCVQTITSNCNSYYDLCTYKKQVACVLRYNCASGWVTNCANEKC